MRSYRKYRRWFLRATAYVVAAMVAGIAVAAQPRPERQRSIHST